MGTPQLHLPDNKGRVASVEVEGGGDEERVSGRPQRETRAPQRMMHSHFDEHQVRWPGLLHQ